MNLPDYGIVGVVITVLLGAFWRLLDVTIKRIDEIAAEHRRVILEITDKQERLIREMEENHRREWRTLVKDLL